MFRLGIHYSVFENECKISGFHGSVDSHILFLVMLPYGLVSYQLSRTLHCCVLKRLHVLMVKKVRSSVTVVFSSRPTLFHKARYGNMIINFKKLSEK